MQEFSFRWFMLLYPLLGTLLLICGLWLLARKEQISSRLEELAEQERPPRAGIILTRSLFFLTLPSLLLSWFPFSWPELIFSVWCLVIVFTAGQLMFHWQETGAAIRRNREELPRRLQLAAANLLSLGLIFFLLLYHLLSRSDF